MKFNSKTKIILFFLVFLASFSIAHVAWAKPSKYTQRAFRWYADGTENGSTPSQTEGTNDSATMTGDIVRGLRMSYQETNGGGNAETWTLWVSINGGAYAQVTTSSTGVKFYNSTSLTDGNATTNRATNGISDGTGSFWAGKIFDASNSQSITSTASGYSEILWSLQFTYSEINSGDYFDFHARVAGSDINSYSVTPRMTVSKTITVSGGCFTDATEATACTDNVGGSSDQIVVSVNGATPTVISTTVNGNWTGSITQPASGATMVFFRDSSSGTNVPEANRATTITKYDGDGGNVDLVKMYESQVVIGTDTGSANSAQTVSDTDMDTSGNGYENSDDADVLVSVDASTFTTNVNSSTHSLYIIGANIFRPASGGGVAVTTTDLYIEGTLTPDANTINVYGNFTNVDAITAGSSTFDFKKASGTQTLNSGGTGAGKIFNILNHSGAGTLQLITNNLSVGSTFTNSAGTFDSNDLTATFTGLATISGGEYQAKAQTQTFNGGLTVSGGTFTGSSGTVTITNLIISSGTFTAPSGTFTINGNYSNAGSGTFTAGTGTIIFFPLSSVTLDSGGTAAGKTFNNVNFRANAYGIQLINNNLNISGTYLQALTVTLDTNGYAVTVGGLATLNGGIYQAKTATQTFNGGLTLSGGTFTGAGGNVDVNGDLTISSGTFTAPSGTFTVSGNYSNAGTLTPGSNTITFDADSPNTQTLNSGGTGAGKPFNGLTHSGTGKLQLITNAIDVNGTFTNSAGEFDTNGQAQTFSGNYANSATFTPGSTTATFDSSGTQTLNSGGTGAGKTFAGLTHSGAGTLQLLTNAIKITGAFNNSNGTFDAGTNSLDQTFSADFTNSATFTPGTTTATFDGSGTQSLNSGGTGAGKMFKNLTHSGSGTLQLSTNDLNVDGNFSNSNGTFDCNGKNQSFAGNFSLSSTGVFTKGGTMTFDGTTSFSDSSNTAPQNIGTVVMSGTSVTLGSSMTADKITVSAGTLDLASSGYTLTLVGSGTGTSRPLYMNGGTLTEGTNSTVKFTGTSASDIQIETYNNLTLAPSGAGSPTYTLLGSSTGFNSCGDDITFNYKGQTVTYGTVTVGSQCWMDRNLGATKVATSYNDCATQDTDCSYGDYFQWGRLDDGHQKYNSSLTSGTSSSNPPGNNSYYYNMGGNYDWLATPDETLWQSGSSYKNNPCPAGWHVPLQSEWSSAMTTLGLPGSCATGSQCRVAMANSTLKLPAAGSRSSTVGTLVNQASVGYYWSSSTTAPSSFILYFDSTSVNSSVSSVRAAGSSVRCIKN